MKHFVSVLVLLTTVSYPLLSLGGEPRAMSLVELLEVPQLSDPRLSPGGSQLLFVLSAADWPANKRIDHIWRLAEGNAIQLTNGPQGERSPRWSPDGRWIAFLADRDQADEEKDQLYLISNQGGEARQLTTHATSVEDIRWAPDGEYLFFRAADAKTAEQLEREKAGDDVFAFDENYEHTHLWRVDVQHGAASRITSGDFSILGYDLARDGTQLAYHRSINPLFGDSDHGEVWWANIEGTNARQLTHNRIPENNARLSPDNQQILFLADANQQFEYYYNRNIFVVDSTGGQPRRLLSDLPYEVLQAEWSADGKSIFFTANMGVQVQLFEFVLANRALRQLTAGSHAVRDWHFCVPAQQHVASIDRPDNPGDVWKISAAGPQPADGLADAEQMTHRFDSLSREFLLPRQQALQWQGADQTEVEGLIFYPIGYEQGRRYPLVVQAHGGPANSDRYGFGRWRDYLPILTAMGYAVFKPNYRGSTGYGDEFLRDMVGHYYQHAHLDVLSGVDYLIEQGIADANHLAMMGWSGGGHMTNKIITYTDRFKAASSGAGAVNWISMYGQSDVRIYRTPWFGGTPWQSNPPIDVYWEHSPLKYISRVKTPTIVLVGEKDVRVPMPQSVELYRALKANGVATHLYVAPRAPHGWQELRHQLFKMNVELDWFEQHVRAQDYTWEKAPLANGGERVSTNTEQ